MKMADEQKNTPQPASESEKVTVNDKAKDFYEKTGVHNGSNTYNEIIHASYKLKGKLKGGLLNDYNSTGFKRNNDIVDIVSDYPWSIDSVQQKKDNSIISVPHCYVVEYQQRYSSTITNLLNTLTAGVNGLDNFMNNIKNIDNTFNISSKLAGLLQNLNGVGEEIVQKGQEIVQNYVDTVQPPAQGQAGTAQPPAKDQASTDQKKGQSQEFVKVQNFVKDATEKINKFFNKKIDTIENPIKNAGGDNNYMQPYNLLYDLKATGHRYCFPMIAEPPTLSLKNTFGDNESDFSNLSANSLFTFINTMSSAITNASRDLGQFSTFLTGGDTSGNLFERTHIEKSKFFQFPTDTDSYTISFPLLNTVQKNTAKEPVWKMNYKFILLFCMRNMIFRKDNTSFYPPLFYDLVIPGTIRQPYTYVESVNVQPLGIVRMLKIEDGFLTFLNKQSYSIPVPEAWMVTIKFKSLIATSANLILSGLRDTPVIATQE